MTEFKLYTVLMNTLSSNNLLLSMPVLGIFSLLLLFALCFSAVHFARLARLGWKYTKTVEESQANEKKEEPPKPEPKKTAPANPSQEPIYYIVERKRQRKKPSYGEPRQIRFQNSDTNANAS